MPRSLAHIPSAANNAGEAKSSTHMQHPTPANVSSLWDDRIPTVGMFAATAARAPAGESSNATHASGSSLTPHRRNPSRYGSGFGFDRAHSVPMTSRSSPKYSLSPNCVSIASAFALGAFVTTTVFTPRASHASNSARNPLAGRNASRANASRKLASFASAIASRSSALLSGYSLANMSAFDPPAMFSLKYSCVSGARSTPVRRKSSSNTTKCIGSLSAIVPSKSNSAARKRGAGRITARASPASTSRIAVVAVVVVARSETRVDRNRRIMPAPRNVRRKRASDSDDDDARDDDDDARDDDDDDGGALRALREARERQQRRNRAKGLDVGTLITGRRERAVGKRADDGDDGAADALARGGGLGVAHGETRMLGTNSAFASAGVVLAGRELVRDGDDGDRGYGLRTAEEARARAYVEEELKRRRGEVVEDDAEANAVAAAGGDDNRGAESWLTAIEEVDVSVERRMQNIEETERAKRAMLDGARPGELGAFDALKPSHMELKEAKKRPPPSETALARRQFVTGFGAKRERQEASEESRREKERRKNFFKKKRNKR